VSLMTRKRPTDASLAAIRGRAARAARQAVPVARQAVPAAKNAGINAGVAARHGAENAVAWAAPHVDTAVAWAAPHVDGARSWAAPHIERSGVAVRDTIAPKISDALVTAAHRLEPATPKSRRWPKVLAAIALLGAGVAMAMAVRRRPSSVSYEPASDAAADETAAPTQAHRLDGSDGSQTESEVNGQFRTS